MISSPHNERLKYIRALQSKPRLRREDGRAVLEGVRLISDALAAGIRPEFVVYSAEATQEGKGGAALLNTLNAHHVLCLETTAALLTQAAETTTPQGVIAVVPLPHLALPHPLRRALILDAISDPGNLGTILRTAAAAGVDAVFLAPGCADPYSGKALRAGMGAHFRIPASPTGWAMIQETCGGLTVYLADAEGERSYRAVDWAQPHGVIIGGEARGAGDAARALATGRIRIPMANDAESLNAAAAAAVILFAAQG